MEKTTNVGFGELIKLASPGQLYSNELVLIRLEDIDFRQANSEVLPVQLEGYSTIIITKGESTVTVDYIPYNLKKGMVLQLMKHNTIQNFNISQDIEGYHLIITMDFLTSLLKEYGPPPPNMFRSLRLDPILQPDDSEFHILVNTIERLASNIVKTTHHYQRGIIRNEVRNFIMELWNASVTKYSKVKTAIEFGRHEELIINFVKLIIQHCKEKHDVSFYSTELCVTSVYLSRTVKTMSGKTAINWISDALIIEAKLMLRDPNMSIQKIAEELNFSDQSSFGKFFKKHTGTSPFLYRQNISK